jgi:hypothetical protein
MTIPSAATVQIHGAIVAAPITAGRRAAPTGLAAIMIRVIGIGTAIAIEKAATGRPNVPASRRQSPDVKSLRRVRSRLPLYCKAAIRPRTSLSAASRVAGAAADAAAGVAGAAAGAA